MKRIVFAVLLFASTSVFAAPFCAVFSYGAKCDYYDMDSCRRAAGSQGGCIINQDEVRQPSGGAPFCVVTSHATQCWHYDAQSCRQAAASSGGSCVVNTNR